MKFSEGFGQDPRGTDASRVASDLKVEIVMRWWVKPYLGMIVFFAWTFGAIPDAEKLTRLLTLYGFKIRIVKSS